jgi:hypothetical protein
MRYTTSTRNQASRCGNTFTFGCFDFKVKPGTQQQTRVCKDSPTSFEVSTDLGYCKVFIRLYSAIAVFATCPRTQGCRFFRTNCRSGRASNLGHSRCYPISHPLRLSKRGYAAKLAQNGAVHKSKLYSLNWWNFPYVVATLVDSLCMKFQTSSSTSDP